MQYSVLIPAFNAARTIGETLAAIVAQTVAATEIIVVDDGSTDETAQIASGFDDRVRVIRQPNQGVGRATSVAMRAASCPLIASVDSDDIWLPSKMAVQLAHLAERPDCGGVFAHMKTFRTDGLSASAGIVSAGWSRTTLVMHTASALAVGDVIDPPGSRGDMVDWIARARHLGLRLDMLDDILALRRVHRGSMSYGRDREKDKGYARVAWLALQRRRGLAQ